jgi:hypothetical protein
MFSYSNQDPLFWDKFILPKLFPLVRDLIVWTICFENSTTNIVDFRSLLKDFILPHFCIFNEKEYDDIKSAFILSYWKVRTQIWNLEPLSKRHRYSKKKLKGKYAKETTVENNEYDESDEGDEPDQKSIKIDLEYPINEIKNSPCSLTGPPGFWIPTNNSNNLLDNQWSDLSMSIFYPGPFNLFWNGYPSANYYEKFY